MLLMTVAAFAKNWTITTTCGKKATLQTADNVTTAQMQEYLTVINYDLCSSIPKHFVING